jgi:SNF family Na+-dependent transporter
VIPAAFIFLGGASGALSAAQSGTFNLGFVTMPMIFGKMPLGQLFSGMWFLLLFIAGITSSVSLIQPAVSFLEDEMKWNRRKAVLMLGLVSLLGCLPAIFFLGHGFVDELDFWGGTLFLVVFATIEIILFAWVYGINKGWEEMHQGAQFKIPKIYKYILKYVTPLYLLVLLAVWSYQQFWPFIVMKGVAPGDRPYQWAARLLIFTLWAAIVGMVAWVWRRRETAPKI